MLTRQKYYPNRIHFAYPRPKRVAEYERIFNCPIRFDQPLTAIYLDKKQVEEKVVTSDYRLLQLLIQYAQEKLADYLKNKDLSVKEIAYLLDYAEPSSFIRWTGRSPKTYRMNN